MQTSLRIVLLLLAGAIILGIIWDAFLSKRRNRRNNASQSSQSSQSFQPSHSFLSFKRKDEPRNQRFQKNPFADSNHFSSSTEHDEFEDVILVKPSPKLKENEDPMNQMNELNQNNSNNKRIINNANLNNGNSNNGNSSSTANKTNNINPDANNVKTNAAKKNVGYANDLVVLNIMARQPGVFLGKKLLDAFQEASLFYGEMNIFHRHENTDGVGRIVFSLASAVEPGQFEISKLETFVTPGLTLFFQIERPNQSIAAFELMLRTAKQLAMRLDAEIKDDEHKFLTLPIIEKYRDRVRQGQVAQR